MWATLAQQQLLIVSTLSWKSDSSFASLPLSHFPSSPSHSAHCFTRCGVFAAPSAINSTFQLSPPPSLLPLCLPPARRPHSCLSSQSPRPSAASPSLLSLRGLWVSNPPPAHSPSGFSGLAFCHLCCLLNKFLPTALAFAYLARFFLREALPVHCLFSVTTFCFFFLPNRACSDTTLLPAFF